MIIVGICPNCLEVITSKKKDLYMTCKECGETVPTRQAASYLHEICQDPKHVNDVLSLCLKLEETEPIEIPLAIIRVLKEFQPHNEFVAYTYVRMSGFEPGIVRDYLNTFAAVKGERPFAADFLENTVNTNFVVFYNLLNTYIDNKLSTVKKPEYKSRLENAKKEYIGRGFLSQDNKGMMLMYCLYIGGTILNLGLIGLFFAIKIPLLYNTFIAIGVFCLELFGLYMHNKTYGNRVGLRGKEFIFVCAYLSSIPLCIIGMVATILI
jgi:hypothetical protein